MDMNLNDYRIEKVVTIKNETYSVRDNGAVFRQKNRSKTKRKYDEEWTFGNSVDEKGFYTIGNEKVHKIVATAFYGEPPLTQYVILHKNFNKKDNRAENLMWVTKFQFHILQPQVQSQLKIITNKKLEEILSNFVYVKELLPENLSWMGQISQQEADKALELYIELKYSDKDLYSEKNKGKYAPIQSLTHNAVQKNNWWIKSEFPCCPKEKRENTLKEYFENLNENSIFCTNEHYETLVNKFAYAKDKSSIYVKGKNENSVKQWTLCKITYEKNIYVHENCGTFFREDGAEKYFTIAIGNKWYGGDVFDDLC